MKKLLILTIAAFACSALEANAQVQILSGQPTLAPRLISDRNPLAELDAIPLDSADLDSPDQSGSTNPFGFFEEDANSAPEPLSNANDLLVDEQPPVSDPTSLPVAKKHRSMVDTIVDQGVMASVADASSTPINWGGSPQTPNPVGQWLLREECVEGLWASYPQQRAAECAHMWSHLNGHSACNSPCNVAGPCSVCAEPARNRYTESYIPAGGSFNGLPPGGCGDAGCSQCAQIRRQQLPANVARFPNTLTR